MKQIDVSRGDLILALLNFKVLKRWLKSDIGKVVTTKNTIKVYNKRGRLLISL